MGNWNPWKYFEEINLYSSAINQKNSVQGVNIGDRKNIKALNINEKNGKMFHYKDS